LTRCRPRKWRVFDIISHRTHPVIVLLFFFFYPSTNFSSLLRSLFSCGFSFQRLSFCLIFFFPTCGNSHKDTNYPLRITSCITRHKAHAHANAPITHHAAKPLQTLLTFASQATPLLLNVTTEGTHSPHSFSYENLTCPTTSQAGKLRRCCNMVWSGDHVIAFSFFPPTVLLDCPFPAFFDLFAYLV